MDKQSQSEKHVARSGFRIRNFRNSGL